jgi:peptidoglycan DL-endopeptidase CwlO
MHRYGPAPYAQDSRGSPWPLALAAFVACLLWLSTDPDLQAVARSSLQAPRDGGRANHSTLRADRAVRFAVAQVGKPYRWGDEGPNSFDCSGLTWAAYRAAGVSIPRTAGAQLEGLPHVRGRLHPGDLVIYRTNGPTRRHVAIVVAPRRIVEARGSGIPVRVTRLRPGWLGVVRP